MDGGRPAMLCGPPALLAPLSPSLLSPLRSLGGEPRSPFRVRRYSVKEIASHPALAKGTPPTKATPVPSSETAGVDKLWNGSEWADPSAVVPPLQSLDAPDDKAEAPPHVMVHKGNKLFWRINRSIDFQVFMSTYAVVVRSFDSVDNTEFPPIIVDLAVVMRQISESESASESHHASLNAHGSKAGGGGHAEDDVMKQRRRKREAEEKKKQRGMMKQERAGITAAAALEEEAGMLRTRDEQRSKVASFIINRMEANKSKDTGAIGTLLSKRPNDTYASLAFEGDPPPGTSSIGNGIRWNKKENVSRIRRKSNELAAGIQAAKDAAKRADEKQKAMKVKQQINSSAGLFILALVFTPLFPVRTHSGGT